MTENIWNKPCLISPSMMCFDLCNLEEQLRMVENSELKVVHIDILDGYFSPSMPLGLESVKQAKRITNLEFEAHVMAKDSQFFIEELIKCGVSQIVFHIETADHADGLLNYIHSKGVRAGVALKSATPLSELEYIIEKCDAVLLMLVNPGYAQLKSERQISYVKRKVYDLKSMIDERKLNTKLILDGRISKKDIEELGGQIANIFVAGTTCICKNSFEHDLKELYQLEKVINCMEECDD